MGRLHNTLNTNYPSIQGSNSYELLLWLLGRRWRIRVTGNSMLPSLRPSEELLVDRSAALTGSFAIGDVVVLADPRNPALKIIKRVCAIRPNHDLYLLGDNSAESTDSRIFGDIPADNILGKVVCKFHPTPSHDKSPTTLLMLAGAAALWLHRRRTR